MASYSSEELFSKICRICLSINISGAVPLFEINRKLSSYGQAVALCTKIELPNLKHAPINMCYGCLHQLRQTILFQKKCKNSRDYFNKMSSNFSHIDIKENVIKHLYRDRIIMNEDKNDVSHENSHMNNDKNYNSDINTDNSHKINDKNEIGDINNDDNHKNVHKNENSDINNDINASSKELEQNNVINPKPSSELKYYHVKIEPVTAINKILKPNNDNDFISDEDSNDFFNELFNIAENEVPDETPIIKKNILKKENVNADKLLNVIGQMIKIEVNTENKPSKQSRDKIHTPISKKKLKHQRRKLKNIKKLPNMLKLDYSNLKTDKNQNAALLEVIEETLNDDTKVTAKAQNDEITTLITEKTLDLLNKSAITTNIKKRVKVIKEESNEINLINLIRDIENKSYSFKYLKTSNRPSKPKQHTKTDQQTIVKKKRKAKVQKMICDTCNKAFANKNCLVRHLERHAGVSLFVCELCGKGFVTKAELGVHLVLSHDTGRHYPCDLCGYKAPRLFDLTEHKRIHTGERPFACDKCGLTFRRRYVWQQHQVYHTEKTLQCSKCPLKFHKIYALRSHENCVHERKYVYNCPICGTSYAQNKSVRRHMVEAHGVARETQGKIERVFINSIINEIPS